MTVAAGVAPGVGGAAFATQVERGFEMALGVFAQALHPLGASPFAGGMLPAQARVAAGTVSPEGKFTPAASWTAQLTSADTARIDLGDGYRLTVDDRSSELVITGPDGHSTRIWGDPHVDVDGQHKFDFWGTTTFTLGNGAKVTIKTEPYAANPNMYVASQVVVTKGANAIVIDGISQNKTGDLSITQSMNGYALDSANRDGYVLEQGANGQWVSEWTGQEATQADLDVTRPGGAYGPGATTLSLGEASGALSLFLFAGSLAALTNLLSGDSSDSGNARATVHPTPRPVLALA